MEPARQQRRAPDERSFERLYRRHRAEVYRALLRELGNREDAEDVTQTAFLDAFRALARGTEPDRPRAWLLTIAENARRRRFRALGRAPEQAELAREPAAAEVEVTARDLREGLDSLPENQRGALVLREIGGFSYAEIGARLGLSVASVQMLLFRARRALRAELEADVATRRRVALLPWPWLGWITGGGGAAGVLPRAAGLVAAGVGAAALTGPGAPGPERQAPRAQPPVRVAPVAVGDGAEPRALAPRAHARAGEARVHVVRPAAPPPALALPAPATSAPPRVTPAPPAPPPLAPPASAAPTPEPAAPAPADTAPPPLPAVELPTVQAPTPAVELPAPTLSPTVPPLPAPPAGPGDLGGAALPGLPTS